MGATRGQIEGKLGALSISEILNTYFYRLVPCGQLVTVYRIPSHLAGNGREVAFPWRQNARRR